MRGEGVREREQPLEQAGSGVPFHVIALIAIQLRNWQKHQFHAAAEQSSSAAPLRNQPTTMVEVEREEKGERDDSVCVCASIRQTCCPYPAQAQRTP